MAFNYHQLSRRDALDVSAREVDLFLDWAVSEHITLSPLLGSYKPDKWQGNGGLQSNNASTNTYFQFIVWMTY